MFGKVGWSVGELESGGKMKGEREVFRGYIIKKRDGNG
jgi:hypothetical protein